MSLGEERFQIIFADPPYEKTKDGESYTQKLVTNKVLPQLLDSSSVFVLEKRPSEILPEMKLWRIVRQKNIRRHRSPFSVRNLQSATCPP